MVGARSESIKGKDPLGRGYVQRVIGWASNAGLKFVWVVTVASFLTCVVWLAISLHNNHVQTHDIGLLVSFFFVLGGLPISIYEIIMHLHFYTRPELQKFIIRILWMVPIYAIDSWLALCFQDGALYFNTLRGCYEAYVIYCFYMYLVTFLGDLHGEDQIIDLLERKDDIEHYFPFCWLPKTRMGEPFLHMCRRGVLAYVIIRVTTIVVTIPLELLGWYGDGEIDPSRGYLYLSLLNNVGAIWAMYCLVAFYYMLKEELEPIRPIPKFLCVKFVVFLSFYQGITLSVLAWTGVLHNSKFTKYTVKDVQTGMQEFLICCEMFFAAIAHHFAFTYKDFATEDCPAPRHWQDMFWMMLDMGDVARDIGEQNFLPDEVSSLSDRATYHIDEQTRLLEKAVESRPTMRWALQNCCGDRFKEKPTPTPDVPRQIPEDYGRDDNKWVDQP